MARILVIGAGAIGTQLIVRLEHAGHQVTVGCRSAESALAIQETGLTAEGPDSKRLHARPDAATRPSESGEVHDLVVLATRCQGAPDILSAWLGAAAPDAPLVALQNGVLGDALAPVAGERLVECTVAFPASRKGPLSVQTGPGGLHLGPWPPQEGVHHAQAAQAILRDAYPTELSTNMLGVKWTKLLINSCITTLGAATGVGLGELLKTRWARETFLAIVAEGHAAGRAAGVRFETLQGFRPAMFASPRGRWIQHLLLRILGRKFRRHRSSSLQALEQGMQTEVDFLNGFIVATAEAHGLEAPVNAALVQWVKEVEEGREPSLAVQDVLTRAR